MSYQLRERNLETLEKMQSNVFSVEANLLAKKARMRNEKKVLFKEEASTSDGKLDVLARSLETIMDRLENMEKGDTIPKYLIKFTQCQDELGSVSVTLLEDDLVSLTLLGLSKSWHSYQDSINGREKMP